MKIRSRNYNRGKKQNYNFAPHTPYEYYGRASDGISEMFRSPPTVKDLVCMYHCEYRYSWKYSNGQKEWFIHDRMMAFTNWYENQI